MMGKSNKTGMVLPAKLTTPKVDNAVPRTRLFQRLDRARQKPVIWVGGPAGSGKTTLVASYLAQHKIKPLWYRFDVRDADPAAFFAYLRQAIGRLSRRKREPLPLLTPEQAIGLPAFTLNFFEQLASRLHTPALLVFDNMQDLPAGSPLHELLPQVVSVLPEGFNLVFISRTEIPPGFAPLRAGRKLAQIRAEELALTSAEAQDISNHITSGGLSRNQVEQLNEQAGMWMAGLVLLLEGVLNEAPGIPVNATVFDYFAAEIMRRTDPETHTFLTRCALLPVMDVETTRALSGNPNATAILRQLVRKNYFISRLPGETMRYEFHPLFRNYLLTELQQRNSDAALRALQRQAGGILTEEGEYSAAVELLSDAGAIEELAALILEHAEKLIASGRYQTLSHWLQALPDTAFPSRPWLCYWSGVSQAPFDTGKAKTLFESSYAAFSTANNASGCYASWSGITECFNLMWGDYEGIGTWLDEFARLRRRFPRYPSVELEIRSQTALFGILILLRPQHPDCVAACKTIEATLVHAADPEFRIRALCNLALYYSWTGEFTDMRRVLESAEKIVAQEPASPLSRITLKIHQATFCWLIGEPQQVHERLDEARRLADRSGVHLLDPFFSFHDAYAHGIQENPQAMQATLNRLEQHLSDRRHIDMAQYWMQTSWCKSLSGDDLAAKHAAYDMLSVVETANATMSQYQGLALHMPTAVARYTLATALAQTGDYAQANKLFELGLQFSHAMNSRHLEFTGLMLRAYSWLKQHNEAACQSDLERALDIATNHYGYWTFPLWNGKKVSQLCNFALQHQIQPGYIRALIRKWQLLPPQNNGVAESWPWPVRIHTLGRFCLLVDDEEVKPTGKTREMLLAIIALGGSDVPGFRISDLLWPDADGDLARHSLKITLHRLRKLLGPQRLLQSDGRLTLDPRQVWVDYRTFESSLLALESATNEKLGELSAGIIAEYQTGFLPNDHLPWLDPEQERLRNRFLYIINLAATRLCDKEQWSDAIKCYQSALAAAPLAERFYQGLMRCHLHLGENAEGLVVYNRCREALAVGLGIQPSALSETLRDRLHCKESNG